MKAAAALEAAGYSLVYVSQHNDVFCDGSERVWVKYSTRRPPAPTRSKPCPQCRCGAFRGDERDKR